MTYQRDSGGPHDAAWSPNSQSTLVHHLEGNQCLNIPCQIIWQECVPHSHRAWQDRLITCLVLIREKTQLPTSHSPFSYSIMSAVGDAALLLNVSQMFYDKKTNPKNCPTSELNSWGNMKAWKLLRKYYCKKVSKSCQGKLQGLMNRKKLKLHSFYLNELIGFRLCFWSGCWVSDWERWNWGKQEKHRQRGRGWRKRSSLTLPLLCLCLFSWARGGYPWQ